MSRTPRRASKQVDYAAYGDGEDEPSLDLNAEDAEDDEDVPKNRREYSKKETKKSASVIIDDNDDDVVLVDDQDDDDFDLGKRILSTIKQKIPEIIKPKKRNAIEEDEIINLEEDDEEPVVTFRNLPKIGGHTVKLSPGPPKELSPREPVVEKQPTKRERTPPKKRVIDSDSDDFSGAAEDDYDDDFGFGDERSKSKKRKAEPKEKKAPAKRAKRNKDDDVSISESISTRRGEIPKPKAVFVVIEPLNEVVPEAKPQAAAPVKEVVIKEVNNTTSSSNSKKKKPPKEEESDEEERSVSTSNQFETNRDKRSLITNQANNQYGGNKSNISVVANGHTSPAKKKNESDEVTSGPSTPIKPQPAKVNSTPVAQSKPIVSNGSPKKPGLSKASGEQSSAMNLGLSPTRRRVGLSRTQHVPSLHGDK